MTPEEEEPWDNYFIGSRGAPLQERNGTRQTGVDDTPDEGFDPGTEEGDHSSQWGRQFSSLKGRGRSRQEEYWDNDREKEFIPEWDGKSESLRVYKRRVKMFVATTRMKPERRANRLLERLKGDAFDKTEGLDPELLKGPDGVEILLQYLHGQYDQQEALRVGTSVEESRENFVRRSGEEVRDFSMRFESKVKEMEEAMNEPLNRNIKAHYLSLIHI